MKLVLHAAPQQHINGVLLRQYTYPKQSSLRKNVCRNTGPFQGQLVTIAQVVVVWMSMNDIHYSPEVGIH